jgi:hypothetical protein
VRDTIARQSDVDKSSMKYEVEPGSGRYRIGTITFFAKKGKSIDLEKIHESIKGTRLSGGTRSAINYLEITVEGTVVEVDKKMLLRVTGTMHQFGLSDDPKAKPEAKTPLQRLREALAKGEKVVTVTGRVEGWSGPWPVVLRELPGAPAKGSKEDKPSSKKKALLVVTDFQMAKE